MPKIHASVAVALAALTLCLPFRLGAEPVVVSAPARDASGPMEWVLPKVEPSQAEGWIAPKAEQADVDDLAREVLSRNALDQATEEARREVLQTPFQPRPPTWIQAGALAGAGAAAALEQANERAERDLQTLNWVIEQQQKEAAARRSAQGSADMEAGDNDRWFRQLLPRHWIPLLKAHREWVVAGGTLLLILVWGASLFARRPTSGPVQPSRAPTRRRRRHHGRNGLQLQ